MKHARKNLFGAELKAIRVRASVLDLGSRGDELLSGFPKTERAAVKEFLQAIKIAKEIDGATFVFKRGAIEMIRLTVRLVYLLETSPWAWREAEVRRCLGFDKARMHPLMASGAIPFGFIDKFAASFGGAPEYLKAAGLHGLKNERFYIYNESSLENRFFMNANVIKGKPVWYRFMETLARGESPLSAAELEKTLDFSDAARMTPRICQFPRGVFDKRIEIVGKRRETRYVMNKQYRKNTWARILPYLDNYEFFRQWSKDPGLGL